MIAKQAIYTISVDGIEVTSHFAPLLTQMSITDSDGGSSDQLQITLDDSEGMIAMPRTGADIVATLCWSDGEGGAVYFEGKTDEPECEIARGGGMLLSISAHSADLQGKPKQKMQKHKDDAGFADVAQEWGDSAGFDVKIDDELGSLQRPYWDMRNESFLAWGARMANEIGATFKVRGKKAVFLPRNGGDLPSLMVQRGVNLISGRLSPNQSRARYKQSVVRYYDEKTATYKKKSVEIKDDGAEVDLVESRHAGSEEQANDLARANAEESKRGKGGGQIQIVGNAAAQAQAELILTGWREGIDGTYRITSVTHNLSRSGGWVTSCELAQPQGEAGVDSRIKKKSKTSESPNELAGNLPVTD